MNLPPFVQIAPDGVPEYFLDHTLLSSARMCESRFILDYVENYRGNGLIPWPLAFGLLIHDCMEWLYKAEMSDQTGDSFPLREWFEFATGLWRERHLDNYSQIPAYKTLGGMPGFVAMLTGYFTFYVKHPTSKLKPVALEVGFGKNREVPILIDANTYSWAPFRLYLAGRMDFIFDDGRRLGPLDHKTFSTQGKNPITTYEVQEGMTGYVYAMTFIYAQLKAQFEAQNQGQTFERETNVVWMNFLLTAAEKDMAKRFQRVPIYKTPFQLEEWRMRQISTCAKIHQMLFQNRPPDFNTSVCTNYWHSTCHYQAVHRLGSQQDQLVVLEKTFHKEEPWNPER